MVSSDVIGRLYFGRDEAELDFASGGLLRSGFLRTSAFEPALERLRPIYPEYADNLTVVSVLDTLYAIGFLGVPRNDGIAYAFERGGRVERRDTAFYLHPCFRPALRALEATGVFEHDDYDYYADRAVAQTSPMPSCPGSCGTRSPRTSRRPSPPGPTRSIRRTCTRWRTRTGCASSSSGWRGACARTT